MECVAVQSSNQQDTYAYTFARTDGAAEQVHFDYKDSKGATAHQEYVLGAIRSLSSSKRIP